MLMHYPKAKSWHDTLEKPRTVKAQEAAHLIGMFSQRICAESYLQHDFHFLLSEIDTARIP